MRLKNLSKGSLNSTNKDCDDEEKYQAQKKNFLSRFLDAFTSAFIPLLPVIIIAGMTRVILYVLLISGWVSYENDTYRIILALSDGVFYFLPILIAFSSAKYFGSNPYIGAAIGGAVLYPDLTSLLTVNDVVSFIGLPVPPISYPSSILPMFLTIWGASYIEKFLNKHTFNTLNTFKPLIVPLLTFFIAVPLLLTVISPIASTLRNWSTLGITFLFEHANPLAGLLLGGVFSIMMVLGMQNALTPIIIDNLAVNGFDHLFAIWAVANVAQGATALTVCWMTKNKSLKSNSLASGIAALFGVIEPAIFGVNLRLRKPFLAGLMGGALAGLFIMIFQTKAYSFIFSGPQWLALFFGDTSIQAILVMLIAIIVPFIILYCIKFEDPTYENQ